MEFLVYFIGDGHKLKTTVSAFREDAVEYNLYVKLREIGRVYKDINILKIVKIDNPMDNLLNIFKNGRK